MRMIETIITLSMVLLLIALLLHPNEGTYPGRGLHGPAEAAVEPVSGLLVCFASDEPAEVDEFRIITPLCYKARPYSVRALRSIEDLLPVLGGMATGQPGKYNCFAAVKYGGLQKMGQWLFFPKKKSPTPEHDLLLMGATDPEAANGYYDEAGEYGGQPYYKHETEEYYIYSSGFHIWQIAATFPEMNPYFENIASDSPACVYGNVLGTGTVVVYPVNVSLSGATNPEACNGTYSEAGTQDGKPYYKHEEELYIYWMAMAGFWVMGTPPLDGTVQYFIRDEPSIIGAFESYEGTGTVTVSTL